MEYPAYLEKCSLSKEGEALQRGAAFERAPLLSLILYGEGGEETLSPSLEKQTYGRFEVLTAGPSALPHSRKSRGLYPLSAAREARGDALLFLPVDSRLSPETLYRIARALLEGSDLIYSDEDSWGADRTRTEPQFKPDFSPETLLAYNYIGRAVAVGRELFFACGGLEDCDSAGMYDFILRAAEKARRVTHLPYMLFTFPKEASCGDPRPLEKALRRRGQKGSVLRGLCEGTFTPRFTLKGEPLFSIVVVNRRSAGVLKSTLEAIEQRSLYENYELIVAADGREDGSLPRYLEALEKGKAAKVINAPGASLSALYNLGAKAATGEHLLFLESGCVPLSPDFCQRLLEWTSQNSVGPVGGKVLYRDALLSCGTVVGLLGKLCCPYFMLEEKENDPLQKLYTHCCRNVTALPPWCMAIDRSLFASAGGFDETLHTVGFGEELCLRLMRRGRRPVFTPTVRFLAEPSPLSELPAPSQENLMRCMDAFRPLLYHGDPFYNPNLDYGSLIPKPALPPRPPLLLHREGDWLPGE